MKAIQVQDDDAYSLNWETAPDPEFDDDEVLIEVKATAVNRADLLQRRGNYPPPEGASPILGLEAAGEVAEVGAEVDDWEPGDRVCALLPGGGYAEYASIPADLLLELPDSMSFQEAAAIPEVFLTAYLNVFLEAEQTAGEQVLLHAGASGVGTAAIQLCHLFDSPVYATASAPKLDFLEEMGVEAAIDRKNDDFGERIPELTDGRGVDIILDPVGGGYIERDIDVLADQGRIVFIGTLGGSRDTLPIKKLMIGRKRLIGSVLRSRSTEEKIELTAAFRQNVWPAFADGTLEPIIHETFPVSQAQKAHDLLHSNDTIGKVVLTV